MSFIIKSNLGNLFNSLNNSTLDLAYGAAKAYTSPLHSGLKAVTMYESTIDLLALSVCWKRLRESTQIHNVGRLLDQALYPHVTPSDIERSKEIKDYYSKKLMLLSIKSDTVLSPFRKDLSSFVHSDGLSFREEMVPLAFRLPEFYEHDTKFDQIINDSKQDFNLEAEEYKFLGKVFRCSKRFKQNDYWFVNNQHTLYTVSIQTNNNLILFWERQLNENQSGIMKLLGRKKQRRRDDLVYFDIMP